MGRRRRDEWVPQDPSAWIGGPDTPSVGNKNLPNNAPPPQIKVPLPSHETSPPKKSPNHETSPSKIKYPLPNHVPPLGIPIWD